MLESSVPFLVLYKMTDLDLLILNGLQSCSCNFLFILCDHSLLFDSPKMKAIRLAVKAKSVAMIKCLNVYIYITSYITFSKATYRYFFSVSSFLPLWQSILKFHKIPRGGKVIIKQLCAYLVSGHTTHVAFVRKAGKVAQWVNTRASKPKNLTSIPET